MQLWLWLHNSDSENATPVTFTNLSPCHLPHHIPCLLVICLVAFPEHTCYTVPSHAHLAYVAVIPSRVFLRVFSLDFILLDWVITSAPQGCPYIHCYMYLCTCTGKAWWKPSIPYWCGHCSGAHSRACWGQPICPLHDISEAGSNLCMSIISVSHCTVQKFDYLTHQTMTQPLNPSEIHTDRVFLANHTGDNPFQDCVGVSYDMQLHLAGVLDPEAAQCWETGWSREAHWHILEGYG